MRRLVLVLSASLLAACAKKEAPAPPPPPPMAPPAPAPINLASVAGTWTVRVMPATGDSTLLTYTMVATADTTGWIINLPKRKPMPVHVMVSGDSVMVAVAEYESVLRKGQRVSTTGAVHLVGDKLVGTTIAHYAKGADSVVTLRTEGTRMPK
jgi:hypothetical protein